MGISPPLKVTAQFTLCLSFCCRIADRMWNLCLADWYRLNRWIHFRFTVTVLWFVQKKVCKCLCSFRQQPFQKEWHLSTSFVIPLSWILIYNLIGVRESGRYLRGVSPLLGWFFASLSIACVGYAVTVWICWYVLNFPHLWIMLLRRIEESLVTLFRCKGSQVGWVSHDFLF